MGPVGRCEDGVWGWGPQKHLLTYVNGGYEGRCEGSGRCRDFTWERLV